MVIKKYLVRDMNEALTRVRYELGKDAIIISQRKVRKPGLKGLFSKKIVEITAAVENSSNKESSDYNREKRRRSKKDEEFQSSLESIKRLMENEISNQKTTRITEMERTQNLNDRILEHNSNVEKENNRGLADDFEISKEIGSFINKLDGDIPKSPVRKTEEYYDKENTRDKVIDEDACDGANIEGIHKEVSELKEMLNRVIKSSANTDDSYSLLGEKLKKLDIDEELYEGILELSNSDSNKDIDEIEMLRDVFEKEILVSRTNLSGRVVLVGPTGVGKTTTIAKLAGRLSLVEKKKVGLITVDTYRIGAVEQLKTYAEIMNIPFKVVITMKEMEEAIGSMGDCDVVLIDTTGRSSKNAMQISELRAFVQKANPDHVNMVVSATTKNSDIKSILQGYAELEYDNIIITKLDETTVYGSLYNIAKFSNKPISFITTGQNVPDDIMVPTKEEIASFILGEEIVC